MNDKIIYCEKCGDKINPKTAVWLELSLTDGNYYDSNSFPRNHESQGGFSFGKACAKTVLKETKKNKSYEKI